MIQKAEAYLKQYFGYSDFRHGQKLIIESILNGTDTLGVMPTGGGKSICYQIPALCLEGITVVISPLISLMKDQIDQLKKVGYPAAMLNSTVSPGMQREVMEQVSAENIKLLFLTPERFRSENFMNWFKTLRITLFAVDEAHCISEWGHDFRPEYRKLSDVIASCGHPPVLALTATATRDVQKDIADILKMKSPGIFVSGFNRDNLIYGVSHHLDETSKNKALIEFVKKVKGPGIIYVSSIKTGEAVYQFLKTNLQLSVGLYHGSLKPELRKKVQEDFLQGRVNLLVATNAFGMGVNKADIRFVIHYSIPGTIEAYYQETGRAGRDGQTSYCLLFESSEDIRLQEFFIEVKNPTSSDLESVFAQIVRYSHNQVLYSDDYEILTGDKKISPIKMDAILKQLSFMELIDYDYNSEEKYTIELLKAFPGNPQTDLEQEIASLSRKESSSSFTVLTRYLVKRLDIQSGLIYEKLRGLKEEKKIRLEHHKSGSRIRALKKTIPETVKRQYEEKYKRKISYDRNKLDAVIQFSNLQKSCRRQFLLNYFGEEYHESNCGKCDICRDTYRNDIRADLNPVQMNLLLFILKNESKVGRQKAVKILRGAYDIEDKFKDWDDYGSLKAYTTDKIESELNILVKTGYLTYTNSKYPVLKLTPFTLSEIKKNKAFFKESR